VDLLMFSVLRDCRRFSRVLWRFRVSCLLFSAVTDAELLRRQAG
jgi:hypothetical protein